MYKLLYKHVCMHIFKSIWNSSASPRVLKTLPKLPGPEIRTHTLVLQHGVMLLFGPGVAGVYWGLGSHSKLIPSGAELAVLAIMLEHTRLYILSLSVFSPIST